jgi:hypothetical protein
MSDKIVSRPGNQKYRDEYDRIFGVKDDSKPEEKYYEWEIIPKLVKDLKDSMVTN